MKLINRHLDDVLEFEIAWFGDDRGAFAETFNAAKAAGFGLREPFVQDNQSNSARVGTVRGLHLQLPPHEQGKLVRVLAGRVLDVVVDLRPGSATHGEHATIELSRDRGNQLWVPRGFAHGFCTLDPGTEVAYKVDALWAPEAERTLAWDDPALGIGWPISPDEATLSDKDARGSSLAEISTEIERASA
jgi:dTDP-4-dehydrorhamnose 3,5-epimerase